MPKILLVEDEVIISEPLGMVLRAQTYTVDIACNGLEALEYCSKNIYDLILLDIIMPLCDGCEFLERATLKITAPKTKVIMLTNLAGGKEVGRALKLGAGRSLLKAHMTPKILLELVKTELA
jgi:CheY-like chemotaxis protein